MRKSLKRSNIPSMRRWFGLLSTLIGFSLAAQTSITPFGKNPQVASCPVAATTGVVGVIVVTVTTPPGVRCITLPLSQFSIGADNSLNLAAPPVVPNFADAEVPIGIIDGTNATFTLAHPPKPTASLILWRNGIGQTQGKDYTLSGSTITFLAASAPQTGANVDALIAWYRW